MHDLAAPFPSSAASGPAAPEGLPPSGQPDPCARPALTGEAAPDTLADIALPVRFSIKAQPAQSRRRTRHGGLSGRGVLHIEPAAGRLTLIDSRRGAAPEPTPRLTAPLTACFDVSVSSRRVFVEVREPDSLRSLALLAPDAASAARIAAALPTQATPAFEAELARHARFLARHARFLARMRAWPVAWVSWSLIAVNLLIFLAMAASTGRLNGFTPATMLAWGANDGLETLDGQAWRWLTGTFEHASLSHLAGNMIMLAGFGPLTERLYGARRFLALYLFTAVAASMASTWHNPMLSALPALIHAPKQRLLLVLLLVFLYNGARSAYVDNAAHLGGLVAGFAIGLALAPALAVPAGAASAAAAAARRSAVLASGVALLMLALFGYQATHPGEAREQELHFVREFRQTMHDAADISRMLTAMRPVPLKSDADQLALSNRLMIEIAPRWNEAYQRLAGLPLPDDSPYRALRDATLPFIDDSRQSITAFALFLVAPPDQRRAMLDGIEALDRDRRARLADIAAIQLAIRNHGRFARRQPAATAAAPAAASAPAAAPGSASGAS